MTNTKRRVRYFPRRPKQAKVQLTELINTFPQSRYPITGALAKILGERVPNDLRGRTYAELIADVIFRKAAKGDMRAIKEIEDRVEGKVSEARPDKVAEPVEWRVVYEDGGTGDQKRVIDFPQPKAEHIESAQQDSSKAMSGKI
jgi:hypothetical protein